MHTPGDLLRAALAEALPLLTRIPATEAAQAPAPGKWCPKEIIGHLLDSANNNLARFVRLQATDHLLYEPYDQEDWVRAQAYAEADWAELLDLWARYNRHIARIMDRVPPEIAHRPRTKHRPLGSTYAPLPADGMPTLDWLMQDYVEHLRHHVRQVVGRSSG